MFFEHIAKNVSNINVFVETIVTKIINKCTLMSFHLDKEIFCAEQ
jgi:hypothetical protein